MKKADEIYHQIQALPNLSEKAVRGVLEVELKKIADTVVALGAFAGSYCFCHHILGIDEQHGPKCRDVRRLLRDLGIEVA